MKKKEVQAVNMILCSEPCKHQRDGFCALDGEGRITNVIGNGCRYFQPKNTTDGRRAGKDADRNSQYVQNL